jgi:hypothetical protein
MPASEADRPIAPLVDEPEVVEVVGDDPEPEAEPVAEAVDDSVGVADAAGNVAPEVLTSNSWEVA